MTRAFLIFALLSSALAQVTVKGGVTMTGVSISAGFQAISITVSPTGIGAPVGGTVNFGAVLNDALGNTAPACVSSGWTSANPSIATVNASTGVATGVSVGTAAISCTDSGFTDTASLVIETAPAFSNPATPCTTPCVLDSGTQSTAYTFTFAASGGTPAYTYSITVGSLPTGLSLTGAVISGTPSGTGTSLFTARVCDSLSACTSLQMSLTILAAVGCTTSGPPTYTCASTSTADTTTPLTSIFTSTAPTTTTCSGMCQNSTADDTQLPGHINGTYKYTRITDGVVLNGKNIANMTSSGGDNDRMFSSPNGDYLYAQADDGVYIFHLGVSGGALQVLNPGRTGVKIGRGMATSWTNETRYYYYSPTNAAAICQSDLILDGSSNPTGTTACTPIFDFSAAHNCPGVTTFPTGWHSDLGLSTNDDTFIVSLGAGQGKADYTFAYSKTRGPAGGPGCAVINFKTGQQWGFTSCTPGSCTGSETPKTQFPNNQNVCWGSNGAAGSGIHNSQGSGDGNYAEISNEVSGGNWSTGACTTDAVGIIMVGVDSGTNEFCSHNHECAGHPSLGLTHGIYGLFSAGFSIRPLSSIHTATFFLPNPPAADHHCGWPHNNGGTFDDTLPWICAGNSAVDPPFGGPLTPNYLNNEIYTADPTLPVSQLPKRFGHTFACGTSAIYGWCPDHVPDGFGAGNAIMIVGPKGDRACFATSMLHSLGLATSGAFRQDAFCIYMGN